MKTTVLSFLLLWASVSLFAQEIRDQYKATHSYDMEVHNKVYDKDSDKVYENLMTKARVYYDASGEWVLLEQLETNKDKPLEISVIDFKNKSRILIKNKDQKVALIKEHREMSIPSYMKDDYKLEIGESSEKNNMTVTEAKYIVEEGNKANADIEMTEYITAPNYLKWMPIIQDDLSNQFPLSINYVSEGKMGMMSKKSVSSFDFKDNVTHNFSTSDLVFPQRQAHSDVKDVEEIEEDNLEDK